MAVGLLVLLAIHKGLSIEGDVLNDQVNKLVVSGAWIILNEFRKLLNFNKIVLT